MMYTTKQTPTTLPNISGDETVPAKVNEPFPGNGAATVHYHQLVESRDVVLS